MPQQAFTATNANRDQHGLRALEGQRLPASAAVRQAKLMAQREQMFHQDLGAVMDDCHLSTAGENVAYGYPSGKSVVNDGWMNSEGHRANILNPSYRLMGIGARQGHDGRWYVAQVFGRKGLAGSSTPDDVGRESTQTDRPRPRGRGRSAVQRSLSHVSHVRQWLSGGGDASSS